MAWSSPREKLLLDFGWRFHLGHAADPSRDFNYGVGQRTYAKSGASFATCCDANFQDADWEAVDLPHDWAVALPFAPQSGNPAFNALSSHGFKPLGRDYPETSIGWYRRRFDLAAAETGQGVGQGSIIIAAQLEVMHHRAVIKKSITGRHRLDGKKEQGDFPGENQRKNEPWTFPHHDAKSQSSCG